MVIKVQGGRVRVDDSEPRVIKIGGVGPQGPVGVVNATAPVTYNSTTKTVGITTGTANGVAPLDANSLVPKANLPSVAINDTFVVNSQAAMLALAAQTGDVAIRTDVNKNFILATDSPSTLADWKELLTPPDAVTSVNGYTGVVTLDAGDVGAMRGLDNLADLTDLPLARTNLGLGSLATKNAVASADITDGTIVNADISASAAIADSKLNLSTTVTGTAVSSTNKIVDASAGLHSIDRPNGIMLYPWLATTSHAPTADVVRGIRFVAPRNMTVTKIGLVITSNATNADNIQVGLFTTDQTLVASSTSASRTVNTGSTPRVLAISLSSSYTITAGTTYVVCYAYDYTSGTGASILSGSNSNIANLFGNTFGLAEAYNFSTNTLTSNMWGTNTFSTGVFPFFVLFDN